MEESKHANTATLDQIIEEHRLAGRDFNSPEVQEQLWNALAYSFANLFPGNPAGFYCRRDDGSYVSVEGEATVIDSLAHLGGCPDRGMLRVPLLPTGNCYWGAIDVDRKDEHDAPIDWPELARQVTRLKLPLVVCRSKGGKGAHLFIFFNDSNGVPAIDVQRILTHYTQLLNLGKCEIFPKQTDLRTVKGFGSGINLPYRSAQTKAYGADGEFLDVITDFINLSFERKMWGSLLIKTIPGNAPATDVEEPGETTVDSAVAYLDRACDRLEQLRDGRQDCATRVCFYLGRVAGGNQKLREPRLALDVMERRLREAIEKSPGPRWDDSRYEVIGRQLRVGMTKPVKIIEDEEIEIRAWPDPPAEEAFAGMVGDFTDLWQSHTEASPIALAAQFITFYGHAIGRKPFYAVGGDDHRTNLEVCLVGPTSFARKGQSYGCVKYTFSKVQLALGVPFIEARGLSTGEGLIAAVRNPTTKLSKKGERKIEDEGVDDKRLLVFESEFASVLRRMTREGNTLSEVIRQAWDTGELGTMTRTAPLRATGAHISLITHVTPTDLQLYLNDVSTMNGFANRFIFIATRGVRLLPDPGRPSEEALREFVVRLAKAIEFGQHVTEMHRSAEAEFYWKDLYEKLNAPRTGRQHNAVVKRAPAHVLRLSMIYALLAGTTSVEVQHLKSAAALWDYAERTSRFVFGDSLGDKLAEKILNILVTEPKGLTTREITHKVSAKKGVSDALRLLYENGQVRQESLKETIAHRGQRWFAV
jgi:hypothetical protein